MDVILEALAQTVSVYGLAALLLGTFWGIVVGALPGMGSVLAISICLPFTYTLPPAAAIALLLGVYCGSVYGGCLSAILINTPGTPQSAATCFDGFALAKKGQAGKALGWATVSSVAGGLISCVILIISGPQLARFALRFGPIETFALILMALTCIISVSRAGMLKGMLAGVIGLFLAGVGPDPLYGDVRFDFGIFQLSAGFDMIAVVVGIFALAEVFSRAAEPGSGELPALMNYSGMQYPKLREIKAKWKLIVKSSLIGSGVGVLPGTGASVAAFISYAEAKRTSTDKENMGKGSIDGVIAPEAANNAVTGGALVPTLALGLPGDPVTAIMLATLVIHGITPGVRLMADNPETVYSAFMTLICANVLLLVFGVIVARMFAKLLRMPESLLFGGVVILCLLGAYGVRSNPFDLYVTFVAGIFGFAMRLYKAPVAPMVIGLVLGNQLELSLRQGLVLSRGNFLSFFTNTPVSAVLFAVTACILLYPLLKKLFVRWRHASSRLS